MIREIYAIAWAGYHAGGAGRQDALVRGLEGGDETRWFLPGFLPCGECGLCRRGLVGACPQARLPLASRDGGVMAVDDRFLTPVDEAFAPAAPAQDALATLPDEVALQAGIGAWALHAQGVASLTAGDFAVWIGRGPLASAGAALCRSRGAHGFFVQDDNEAEIAASIAAMVAAPATSHGARKRLLFLTEPDARSWSVATRLADAGATFVAFGVAGQSLPGPVALPSEARVAFLAAYHPDFVTEALAALRRNEYRVPVFAAERDAQADDGIVVGLAR